MKRMCCDELKEMVRRLIEESGTDRVVAISALRELVQELDDGSADVGE